MLPNILITGATGLLGHHIVRQLAGQGQRVRVLVRRPEAARATLPPHVEIVHGDLADSASLKTALSGIQRVFHAAGMPEQWQRDPSIFRRINTEGTAALSCAALEAGVESFLYVSTIDVFSRQPGQPFDETAAENSVPATPYQQSKLAADRAVVQALQKGLPARFVHPSALFGPSPSHTPGLNNMLADIARGKLPIVPPGGMPLVYAPDAAAGCLLAEHAPIGTRYILNDRYLSLAELAAAVRTLYPSASRPKVLSPFAARMLSQLSEVVAKVLHRPPLLPAGQLAFLNDHVLPDSRRACTELGWQTTPLETALAETLAALLGQPQSEP